MFRLTKSTDYALVLLAWMALHREQAPVAARDLAEGTGIPLPMVSKVLKQLAREDYLRSTRGSQGGYRLAREPRDISVADLIHALEGPVSLTECSVHDTSQCAIEGCCPVSTPLQRLNAIVIETLEGITLEQLATESARTGSARRFPAVAST